MDALLRDGKDWDCPTCGWWTFRSIDEQKYYSMHHHGTTVAVYFDISHGRVRVFLNPNWSKGAANEYLHHGEDVALGLSIYNQWVRELSTE